MLAGRAMAQFTYATNNGALTITTYTGSSSTVIIPGITNGLPIVRIETNAFQYSSVSSVSIPSSVTNIGSFAFDKCYRLTTITVNALNSVYSSSNGILFDKNQIALFRYPSAKSGSYIIPNSVTNIGDGAFDYCTNLTGVTIPNGVTTIGISAFNRCTSLSNVTIPNSVTSLGDSAFDYCTNLTGITIPDSITSIGYSTFVACFKLSSVTIPNSVTNIGSSAFEACLSLTSVTISTNVISIGDMVFVECSSLTAIAVDAQNSIYSSLDGVLFDKNQTTLIECPGGKVGNYAIPGSVTNIGPWAFGFCTSLTNVMVPNSVTDIGDDAFESCYDLTNVTIPNSVTSIGVNAFADCVHLTSVIIPNSVTNISFGAFSSCPNLTRITLPNSVTSIEEATFSECYNLTSVTIPNSVTNIGDDAFLHCYSLSSIVIPNSVTSIGIYAFGDCSSLKALYFQGNAPNLGVGGDVFYLDSNITIYYLPGTTGWGPTLGGFPTTLWNPRATAFSALGGHFGFNITGPANVVIVVEACTDFVNPVWLAVSTNKLTSGGVSSFSDSQSENYPRRFYRFRSP